MATNLVDDGGATPATTRPAPGWERYAWVAGILFVLVVLVESAIGVGVGIDQNDSAAKIASALADHKNRLLVVEGLCVVYAAMFPIYLWKLYDRLLHMDADGSPALGSLLLVGGVLFVALHAVSDVGIYGVLNGKLASFGARTRPQCLLHAVPVDLCRGQRRGHLRQSLRARRRRARVQEWSPAAAGLGGPRSSLRLCSFSRPSALVG